MKQHDELLEFVSGPVLLMVCAADAARRPAIGRAMGVRVRAIDRIDVMLSRWQWPDVVRNIGLSGRLALTASRASDYVTYQLKGSASVHEADADELECARRYWSAISEELGRNNVPPHIYGQWTPDREMVTARLRVAEMYVQTPGPKAGTAL
jgi:hypothetical protein